MTLDAIVVGSGFGGAMTAHALVRSGHRVLMLERGGWVARGPENWGSRGAGLVTPHYTMEAPYQITSGRRRYRVGFWSCVGGQSVFYGGASFRFRERDFETASGIVGDSSAEWPLRYDDLEPFYAQAEQLLGVAGESGGEPFGPPRSAPYPQCAVPLAPSAQAIADAALRLGLTPSRIPLAIGYAANGSRRGCLRCGSCDGYACAAEAKNDIASAIIPDLLQRGMALRPNTVCTKLVHRGSRVTEVECVNRVTGERERMSADTIVLGAGALATPHLLLASGLSPVNPAGSHVGRYLTRHRNVAVFGLYRSCPNPERRFDKQVAILDFYGAAGSLQQISPPLGLVRAYVAPVLRGPAALIMSHAMGLLAIAEDQPRRENDLTVDWSATDRYGLPTLRVRHDYSERDETAAALLTCEARRVLREAGAYFTFAHRIDTFSHALGTVRMGRDERTSPLDERGRYRGLDNLYVVDGSALPRSAGLNPSLTIAANALRIGACLARSPLPARGRSLHVLPTAPRQS